MKQVFSSQLTKAIQSVTALAAISVLSVGCGKTTSFSLLPDENIFSQNSDATTSGKMDILWVVDNSGSMDSSQQAIADNFARFIDKFTAKGFDFRMAVTTSEAYRDKFNPSLKLSRFRDGTDWWGHTGTFVVDPMTPNLNATFLKNMRQGVSGSGDERVFQSIETALSNPDNKGLLRPGAFFSVIIVSDEDDFSHDGSESRGGQYAYSGLHPVQRYVDYLDQLTGATAATRAQKYNVNSIAVLDADCKALLDSSISGRKIGKRYMELSAATGGLTGSLCGDFGTTLADISGKIIELSTQFYLDRIPDPTTIRVIVEGVEVPNDPTNGYQYHGDTNSISFHGTAIPGPGAKFAVKFDPISLR